jgi:hypothetical protein
MPEHGVGRVFRLAFALILLLPFGLISACLLPVPSPAKAARRCVQGRPPNDRFPFLGLEAITHTSEVTIYGDALARKGIDSSTIEQAAAKWNESCPRTGHVPHFVVDWTHDRPQGDKDSVYRTTILIVFEPALEAPFDPQEGGVKVAEWLRADNSIAVFGKCGRIRGMPCEETRGAIIWKSNWGSMVIAHEIGHALGLWHDMPRCKERGLMQAILNKNEDMLPILSEYCRFAEDMNNEESACNKSKAKSERNPCDDP